MDVDLTCLYDDDVNVPNDIDLSFLEKEDVVPRHESIPLEGRLWYLLPRWSCPDDGCRSEGCS